MDQSNNDTSLGIAARYLARLGAADCTQTEREACERWIRSSAANARAFRDASSVSLRVERMAASDARLQALTERALAAPQSSEPKRIRRPRLAFAAGVLLATLTVWMATAVRSVDPNGSSMAAEIYHAPRNTAREVVLSDGSIVHIDAGSSISADLSSRERRVSVLSGRALFEVAHDVLRPFVVTANNTKTVALGTQFEVDKGDSETAITLVEGSIAVSELRDDAMPWSELLKPGNRLSVVKDSSDRTRGDVETGSVISWSRGWLVFAGTRLDEAVSQINRYSSKKITLAEGSLGEMSIAGSFIAGESESIVNAMAEVLPLRAVDAGSQEILLFKRYDN